MTRDEIIRMAREAGAEFYAETLCVNGKDAHDFIERFAALVAAHSVADYKMLQEIEYVGKLYPDGLTNQIEAAVLAEREACAKVCEEIEQDHWNLYKGRPPYTGSEAGRADPHEQGVSMGAGECAAAIRARGEK